MLSSPLTIEKHRYIKHPLYENLVIIPYRRGRLVFAELAARAIEEGDFDLVLVDIPYFMNNRDFLILPTRAFPLLSSLVMKRYDSKFINFSFAPCDAACLGIAMTGILRDRGWQIELQCIDDSNIVNYQEYINLPEIRFKDDYFVFVEGLEKYFANPFDQLGGIWDNLSQIQRYFFRYRASTVRRRLERYLKEGKNTLFLCEYTLWWFISRMVEIEKDEKKIFYTPWKDMSAALVLEDPYLSWSMGLLDDFPSAVLEFYNGLASGGLFSFDKLDAVNKVIASTLSSGAGNPSVRKVKAFYSYLRNRLCASLNIVPPPVLHLYDAAFSCVGKGFAKKLAEEFLRYPLPSVNNILKYLTIHIDAIVPGGEAFEIPDLPERTSIYGDIFRTSLYSCFEERIKVVNRVRPCITGEEWKKLRREAISMTWEIEKDSILHQTVCSHVKEIAEKVRRQRDVIIEKSWGSTGDGIHWKATIASRATGEDAIYIKKRKTYGMKCFRFNEYTPVVFMFYDDLSGSSYNMIHDSNITDRNKWLGNGTPSDRIPPPDWVYSIFFTFDKRITLFEGHIEKYELTSITFLCTMAMGLRRYKHITRRDKRFQCRTMPNMDPELRGFSLSERGVAWAIKYAEESVLVVARDGWKPSPRLMEFAKVKRIELIRFSISDFSPEIIERMRSLYAISTPLKKHPECNKILDRFIE